MLLERLSTLGLIDPAEPINLFVDRKDTKKQLRENFIKYLTSSTKSRRKLNIELHSSHENKSLQAIDFISWAIFRKYERDDLVFYNLIKDKIVDEKLAFP